MLIYLRWYFIQVLKYVLLLSASSAVPTTLPTHHVGAPEVAVNQTWSDSLIIAWHSQSGTSRFTIHFQGPVPMGTDKTASGWFGQRCNQLELFTRLSSGTPGEPLPCLFHRNFGFMQTTTPSLSKTMQYLINEMFQPGGSQPWRPAKLCFFVIRSLYLESFYCCVWCESGTQQPWVQHNTTQIM